ncbi:MAG TPA: hypothetical protein VHK90_14925, partial [Thermoanaerobaculia bacterium]|nr:hypothetical protein [Thermoanaerobaculia bacterium]
QLVLGRVVKVWKREFVPWKWGVLNAGLLVVLILVRSLSDDPYRILPLVLVVIANAIGFVIDILLIDEYDFI